MPGAAAPPIAAGLALPDRRGQHAFGADPHQLGREAYTEAIGTVARMPCSAGSDQLIPALAGNYRLLTGLPVTRIDHGAWLALIMPQTAQRPF